MLLGAGDASKGPFQLRAGWEKDQEDAILLTGNILAGAFLILLGEIGRLWQIRVENVVKGQLAAIFAQHQPGFMKRLRRPKGERQKCEQASQRRISPVKAPLVTTARSIADRSNRPDCLLEQSIPRTIADGIVCSRLSITSNGFKCRHTYLLKGKERREAQIKNGAPEESPVNLL